LSNVVTRFATKEPTVCAVCRRRAIWAGYTPRQREAIIWLCDDNKCHEAARRIYAMPNKQLDAFEIGAALEAAGGACAYLEEISQTDLARLSDAEFREFLRRMFVGFEVALRRKILGGEPPF
jgi:hypothetical protein